jgi:peptidoglycan hydrolase-like protein with peptidoglycan-binding domain
MIKRFSRGVGFFTMVMVLVATVYRLPLPQVARAEVTTPGTPTTATPSSDSTPTWNWTGSAVTDWQELTPSPVWTPSANRINSVAFNGKMWVLDDLDMNTWSTANGQDWTEEATSVSWGNRSGARAVVFNNKVWVMGGSTGVSANDVYYSSNGTSWTQATAHAGWAGRLNFGLTVFNNKMWVYGGEASGGITFNDVWSSTDGISWTEATADAGWASRAILGTATFNNKLWVYSSDVLDQQDAWSTSDGITWTQEESANYDTILPIADIINDGTALWVVGCDGSCGTVNIWKSTDGITWTSIGEGTFPAARAGGSGLFFNSHLWVFGGYVYGGSPTSIWENQSVDHYNLCWDTVSGGCTYSDTSLTSSFTHSSALADGTWYFKAQAVDQTAATSSFSSSGSVVIYTSENPSTPGTPSTSSTVTDHTPAWSWAASLGGANGSGGVYDIDHYNLCWDTVSGGCTYSDTSLTSAFTHTTDLANGTWYFKVQAVDTNGGLSSFSPSTSTELGIIPSVPGTPSSTSSSTDTTPTWTWASSTGHGVGFAWSQPTAHANWETRDGHVALTFNNKMWIMGGYPGYPDGDCGNGPTNNCNDVWSSTDGITWTEATAHADWSPRWASAGTVFDGKMWIMGGCADDNCDANDVWSSTDGITWTEVTAAADWPARESFSVVTLGSKMYVVGGCCNADDYTDVWSSTDGATWTLETNAAEFGPRYDPEVVALNGKLYMIGGYDDNGGVDTNDVWSSTDGATWTQITADAGWSPRESFSSAILNGQIWVLGGYNDPDSADAWSSSDGITWTEVSANPGWENRGYSTALGFNNSLWVLGGSGNDDLNDVWSSIDYSVDHYSICWDTVAGGCTYSATSTNATYTHTAELAAGTWYFKTQAVDALGNTSTFSSNGSITIAAAESTLTADTTAPTLILAALPAHTNASSVTVSGTATDIGGLDSVTVNGASVSVISNAFSKLVSLDLGDTTIIVTARDQAGNYTTETHTITRNSFIASENPSVPIVLTDTLSVTKAQILIGLQFGNGVVSRVNKAIVITFQTILKDLGYFSGKVTGFFGTLTKNGLKQFQKDKGLKATGKVDAHTLANLDGYSYASNPDQYVIALAQARGEFTLAALQEAQHYQFKKDLKLNQRGPEIRILQRKLYILGYFSGTPTGYFSSSTRQAVREFQTNKGIKVTGVVDAATREKLNN